MKHFALAAILITGVLIGCSSENTNRPAVIAKQSNINGTIRLKDIATGEKIPSDIASPKALANWTFMDKSRLVETKLVDGSILAELKISPLDYLEVDALKEELTKRFISSTPNFEFSCSTEEKTFDFSDKRVPFTEEVCRAGDSSKQTLVITRSWARYQESPPIEKLFRKASVVLSNPGLISQFEERKLKQILDAAKSENTAARRDL